MYTAGTSGNNDVLDLLQAASSTDERNEGTPRRQPYRSAVLLTCAGTSALIGALLVPFVAPGWRKITLPFLPATTEQVRLISGFLRQYLKNGHLNKPPLTDGASPFPAGVPAVPQALSQGYKRKMLEGESTCSHLLSPSIAWDRRRLVDLGSGDGRLVIAAAKEGMQATGVELNWWLVMWSRIQSWKMGRPVAERTAFYTKDLFKVDLKEFEVVVLFGVEGMMKAIKEKLNRELRDDAIFVACRFALPDCRCSTQLGSGVDTVWIYRKADIVSHSSAVNTVRNLEPDVVRNPAIPLADADRAS